MARLKSRMFLVSAQALKLLTKQDRREKKEKGFHSTDRDSIFLYQWNVRIRDKFIYSVYSTFKLIEKKINEVKHCIQNETYPFMIEIDFCWERVDPSHFRIDHLEFSVENGNSIIIIN